MKPSSGALLSVLVISLLLIVGMGLIAEAGHVEQDLKTALGSLEPDSEVPVIVTFKDKVDHRKFKDFKKKRRREKLITAAREKADISQGPLRKLLKDRNARRIRELWSINALAAKIPAHMVEELKNLPGVDRVKLDREIKHPGTPSACGISPVEWNINAIRAPELWALGHNGQGVVVASLDTGVDPFHPDLANWRGGNNSWFDPNGEYPYSPGDTNGHGTWSMGLLVGGNAGGSPIGVAPGAQWIAVKIFDDMDVAELSDVHLGYQWLLDPDGNPLTDDAPDIINNSWVLNNVNQCDTEFALDLVMLKAAEIAVVFAAGNTGPNPYTSVSPSNNLESLSIGSVGEAFDTFFVSNSSARGPSACDGSIYPQVVAPGSNVVTSDLTFGGIFPDSYTCVSGTSFAAPHVSGAMALLKGALESQSIPVTVSQLESAIQETAVDLGPLGPDNDSGSGLLDVMAAYNWLADPGNTAPTVTITVPNDGDSVVEGTNLTFTGTASDPEDGDLAAALAWTSSRDGAIGSGPSFSTTTLSVGTHTITASVTDSGGLSDSDALSLTITAAPVNTAPTVTITTPNDGDSVVEGSSISFAGTATDFEDGSLAAALAWTSSRDGAIGTGASFSTTTLSVGTHTITAAVTDSGAPTGNPLPGLDSFTLTVTAVASASDVVYFSFSGSTSVPGVGTVADEDIVSYNMATGTWAFVFDGSASAVSGSFDVNAFHILPNGSGGIDSILMSFDSSETVSGVGTVDDSDIVKFTPDSPGSSTGNWELYFDGSDVGLTSGGEDIDGLQVLANGNLLISTTGNFSVPGASGTDEDVLVFTPISLGPSTAGTWAIYLDGSDVGLGGEDINAIAFDENAGTLFFSTDSDYTLSGVGTVGDEDILGFTGTYGPSTSGIITLELDLSGMGISTDDAVDAMSRPAPILGNNTAPTVTTTAPADGTSVIAGSSISFAGTATDFEDGNLAASLAWTSDRDGAIGTGASFSTTTLSVGTHTITASVTDSGGLPGSDALSLTITAAPVNTAPTVTITTPNDGDSVVEGTNLTFTGTASDPEDGNLAAALAWTSSRDGAIGTGASFSTTTLSVGTHTITAAVTDSGAPTGNPLQGFDSLALTLSVGTVPPPPAPPVSFSDNFDSGDLSAYGQMGSGNWSTVSEAGRGFVLRQTTNAGTLLYAAAENFSGSYQVTAEIWNEDNDAAGVAFRVNTADADNFYSCAATADGGFQAGLWQHVNDLADTPTTLLNGVSWNYVRSRWYTVTITVDTTANTIRCQWESAEAGVELEVTAVDPDPSATGTIGIWLSSEDNFRGDLLEVSALGPP